MAITIAVPNIGTLWLKFFKHYLSFMFFSMTFCHCNWKSQMLTLAWSKPSRTFLQLFCPSLRYFQAVVAWSKTLKKFWTKSMCFFTVVSSSCCNCISVRQKKSNFLFICWCWIPWGRKIIWNCENEFFRELEL